MTSFKSLVYRSRQTALMTPSAMNLLLQRARIRNERLGLTGVLLHDGTCFMQCLEGPAAAIDTVYPLIAADRRHRDVELVFERNSSEREFKNWAMGYVSVHSEDRPTDLRTLGLSGETPEPGSARQVLVGFLGAQSA